MQKRTITRCVVLMASAGWPFLPGSVGCAQGGADDGVTGVITGGGALADAGLDVGPGATGDANGDATTGANDAQDTGDAENAPEGASRDAIATSDAVADAVADTSLFPDAPAHDGGAGEDASMDASADVVDAGPPVGASCTTSASCGIQALCVAGVCTPSRRVFVSTQMFTGNLGGVSGADHACQSLAGSAQLGGSWKAWVSDNTTSPSTRFAQAAVGYRLLDGTLLAAGWTGLVSGALLHGIDLTEQRAAAGSSEVWTGTLETGVAIGTDVCGGFTSSANAATHAVIGNTSRTDIGWSNATAQSCDQNNLRIYCMEQ
jgi:hypothetical protein